MRRNWQSRLAIISGTILLSTGIAFAGMTLRQREFAKNQDEYFKRDIDSANGLCATKFAAKIDWEGFKDEIDKSLDGKHESTYSFSGYCGGTLGTLGSMCSDADAKASIQKRIKSYTCKFGGEGKRKLELKGSTLTIWIDWKASNYDDYVRAYLGKVL